MKVRMNENSFELTSNREIVTAFLKYICFDYYFLVLLVNVTG